MTQAVQVQASPGHGAYFAHLPWHRGEDVTGLFHYRHLLGNISVSRKQHKVGGLCVLFLAHKVQLNAGILLVILVSSPFFHS